MFGMLASVFANANRSKKRRPFKPEDFIPKWDNPARWQRAEQSDEDMLRVVRRLNRAMGGAERVRRRGASDRGDAG